MKTMSIEDALKVKREPIVVGGTYEFYCTMQQSEEPPELRLRNYTGQAVTVTAVEFGPESHDWDEGESVAIFLVRASDGREFSAYGDELNDWMKDTGQFFWPDGTYGPEHDESFLVNER